MTHASCEAVECGQSYEVTSVVLQNLQSERDLDSQIHAFFEKASEGSLLLLQVDMLASTVKQVEQAKFMCEQIASKKPDCNANIIMLLHLPRSQSATYPLNFSRGWTSVFIDECAVTKGVSSVPAVGDIVAEGLSLKEVVDTIHSEGHLPAMLEGELQNARARLQYPHTLTTSEVCGVGTFAQELGTVLLPLIVHCV